MLLLGINCGFGNNDCGNLPLTALGTSDNVGSRRLIIFAAGKVVENPRVYDEYASTKAPET
jgi:hypothetical protein